MSWGPSHQSPRQRTRWREIVIAAVMIVVLFSGSSTLFNLFVLTALIVGGRRLYLWARSHLAELGIGSAARQPAPDPLELIRRGSGVYLGVGKDGRFRRARAERATLVLGPPRAGKTSGVIIPTVLAHQGPAVVTSTKPDVLHATARVRGGLGTVWQFDPTGTTPQPPAEVNRLRWSPVSCAGEWDGALLMARAMVSGSGVGQGTTDASHWARRAQALLAPLLHAAALGGREIGELVGWVMRHDLAEPASLLERHGGAEPAIGTLIGLQNTEARERSSIFSAAADALEAYSSHAALAAAEQPNFFPGRFVRSRETIYIHAPAENQHLAAPLVCGLLAEIRRARYALHRDTPNAAPVLFALDEVANIAPLGELPQIASEGGSQGIMLLAALQDLSQARQRWGDAADGFLTLFGTKLLLRGIVDHKTLETVSAALGEYDRRVVSHTRQRSSWWDVLDTTAPSSTGRNSTTHSTQRTRNLSPGDVASIPEGKALHLDGIEWELLTLTPAHSSEPWRTLITTTPAGR